MSRSEPTEQAWTDEEVAAFEQTIASFRDGLPPREREAFNAILAGAAEAGGEDVQGYFFGGIGLVVAGNVLRREPNSRGSGRPRSIQSDVVSPPTVR